MSAFPDAFAAPPMREPPHSPRQALADEIARAAVRVAGGRSWWDVNCSYSMTRWVMAHECDWLQALAYARGYLAALERQDAR